MKVTKTQVVWWKLFPILMGDKVRILIGEFKGKTGIVLKMTVPVGYHGENPHIDYFKRVTYDVIVVDMSPFPPIRSLKRWGR